MNISKEKKPLKIRNYVLSKPDEITTVFWNEKSRFACFMNRHLFNGEDVIKTKDLETTDTMVRNKVRDVPMIWHSDYGDVLLGMKIK